MFLLPPAKLVLFLTFPTLLPISISIKIIIYVIVKTTLDFEDFNKLNFSEAFTPYHNSTLFVCKQSELYIDYLQK